MENFSDALYYFSHNHITYKLIHEMWDFSLAIDEVGGVPFEILEPVLERCTPEQLYRIEQCNQVCVHTSMIILYKI